MQLTITRARLTAMRFLSNRLVRTVACIWLVGFAPCGTAGDAAANSDLLDVIARIDYGFYAGDVNLIVAASAELEHLRSNERERAYYGAYAAWRLNQIDAAAAPRLRRERSERCFAATGDLVEDPSWALEAHVLAAACALAVHGDKSTRGAGMHAKVVQAIDAARAIDAENPRLLLIAALALRADDSADQQLSQINALETALVRFDAVATDVGLRPAWGRAEALAHLGKLQLARGQTREARDLIERALLDAPEYHFALQLQKALSLR